MVVFLLNPRIGSIPTLTSTISSNIPPIEIVPFTCTSLHETAELEVVSLRKPMGM